MKKLFLVFVLLISSQVVLNAEEIDAGNVLLGKIDYNVDTAREEAFKDVVYSIPKDFIKQYIKDKDFAENENALKYNILLKDRDIKLYNMKYASTYGVEYKNDMKYTFFYWQKNGYLKAIAVNQNKNEEEYPMKIYYYNPLGDLVNINLTISPSEEFIFNKDGSLNCRWAAGVAYDAKGKKVGSSYIMEPAE